MDINFKFIGWCNEDNHDKIWTAFEVNKMEYVAWGKRGAKLQFKLHGSTLRWSARAHVDKLIEQKRKKGYNEVDALQLFTLFPAFEDKVKEELKISTLGKKIR